MYDIDNWLEMQYEDRMNSVDGNEPDDEYDDDFYDEDEYWEEDEDFFN